ncbi:MAG TPA: hypothetical protein VFS07_09065 [Gemmatimonadales bacterium]|nr:hypothetical protein [Gemmatimonadales bacterium]
MTDTPLSFDEGHAATGPVTCARCATPLDAYWSVGGHVLCERCKDEVVAVRASKGGAAGRVARALGLGVLGMLVGAGVWYGVARAFDLEVGLIAILLGWLVGKGVFVGSGRRGGLGYQVMAVLLTYFGIGLAYSPFALEAVKARIQVAAAPADSLTDQQVDAELARLDSSLAAGHRTDQASARPGPLMVVVGLGALVVAILALPVLIVVGGGVISVLFYAIALFEAWRFTRAAPLPVSGPYPVGGSPGS